MFQCCLKQPCNQASKLSTLTGITIEPKNEQRLYPTIPYQHGINHAYSLFENIIYTYIYIYIYIEKITVYQYNYDGIDCLHTL